MREPIRFDGSLMRNVQGWADDRCYMQIWFRNFIFEHQLAETYSFDATKVDVIWGTICRLDRMKTWLVLFHDKLWPDWWPMLEVDGATGWWMNYAHQVFQIRFLHSLQPKLSDKNINLLQKVCFMCLVWKLCPIGCGYSLSGLTSLGQNLRSRGARCVTGGGWRMQAMLLDPCFHNHSGLSFSCSTMTIG